MSHPPLKGFSVQNTFSETSPDHKSGHTSGHKSGHKSGWIGLIGPTNAGKSTLLNQLIGDTLAIVTPKPQTTRHQIKGIYTDKEAQLIFCDTPGLHQGDDSMACMNKEMLKVAYDTLKDVDCICLVLDSAPTLLKVALQKHYRLSNQGFRFLNNLKKHSFYIVFNVKNLF